MPAGHMNIALPKCGMDIHGIKSVDAQVLKVSPGLDDAIISVT